MVPEAMAILKEAKKRSGITEPISFIPLPEEPFRNVPVLALGRLTRGVRSRVINAPSPGSLYTKADSMTRMIDALKLLVNQPDLPVMKYIVEERLDFVLGILNNTRGKKISFDIETSGDVKWDIPSYDKVISVAIWGGQGSVMVIPEHILQNPLVERGLNKFLRRNKIITANGKFDLSYFEPGATNWFDIMLAHYALFPAGSTHGLKDLADQYFGSGDWDEGNKAYTVAKVYKEAGTGEDGTWWDARKYSGGSGYERIPRTILYEYNAYDVFYTWFLYQLFEDYLAQDDESRMAYEWLLELSELFSGVERRGIKLNVAYLQQLEEEMTIELYEAEAELAIVAGQAINPRSPQQVLAWLHSRKKRVKGTGKPVMERLMKNPRTSDEVKDFITAVTKCRFISKQLGTYVTGFLKHCHGDMVYPGYKLHAASTGRLGGSGASMLTIPRDKRLKQMVLPSEPGHVVVTADMSQAELRVMAMESGDPWLIAAFQPDAGDIFDILLSAAMPKVDWAALHARADDGDDPNQFYQTWRARMKGVVYGVSFGRGVPAIASALEVDQHTAQVLVDGFVRPGSKFAEWREMIEAKALAGGSIVTKFGRHFQSEIITEQNEHEVTNSALSFTSQSTANDICLKAAVWLDPQLEQYGAWLMGTIHDAIYVTCPEEHKVVVGNLIAEALRKAGQDTYGDVVPFAADAGYGPNLAKIEKLAA
jgi:DNA polymerase I-like protein with 3'-5' exonuclease and polymerase domains